MLLKARQSKPKRMKKIPILMAAGFLLGWAANVHAVSNLVPNGDFEASPFNPPVSFSSDYTLVSGAPGSLVPESTFYVGTNPSLYHGSFGNYYDHTLGTANGHMLIANGSSDTSKNVWKTAAPIAVTPGTDYYFEAWISSAHPTSPAVLSFELDGDVSDATLGTGSPSSTVGLWSPVSKVWNSGANTSVLLFLRNANPAFGGNDFAIDDIHFGETSSIATPEASPSLIYACIGFGSCLLANRRFRR